MEIGVARKTLLGEEQTWEPQKLSEPWREYEQQEIDRMNASVGALNERDGYDCPLCMNRGYTAVLNESGYAAVRDCECKKVRKSIAMAKTSGAYDLIQRYRFDNFQTGHGWQKQIKEAAQRYITDGGLHWFYAGGQTGSGKTHICTAVFSSFFQKLIPGMYIMWRQEARQLTRSSFSESREVDERINELCTAKALYIDDLFKTDDNGLPLPREIELAFEIINSRYNRNLVTIFSSELLLAQLSNINQAIAGRILEKCTKQYVIDIAQHDSRNYRLGIS